MQNREWENMNQLSNEEDQKITVDPQALRVRSRIVDILDKIESRFAYSDKLLQNELDEFAPQDRSLAVEIVHGVMRWREKLDWYIRQLYKGEFENLLLTVKSILRAALYQLIFLDRVPAYAVLNESVEIAKSRFNQRTANLVNAILRNFIRQEKKLDWMLTQLDILDKFSIQWSHPRWLIQRWIEYWGIDEVEMLCMANNQPSPIFVKVNLLKITPDEFERMLREAGIPFDPFPLLEGFYQIEDFQAFRNGKFLENGFAFVQDPSAALPVLLLKPEPGLTVWDMCAAPGAKTVHLAVIMRDQGMIIASDLYAGRVKLIQKIAQNMNLTSVIPVVGDALTLEFRNLCDKILLDAPCSGFGVLRKRSDLRWKKTEQEIHELTVLQRRLLEKAAYWLKPGGELVYSTCTIEPEENEQVIHQFLSDHPEFSLIHAGERIPGPWVNQEGFIRTFPHRHEMDGSFAALMKKSG